ncbi:PRAME family member 12-like [Mastomys coucha]|uniref:PRAME family member 12-like n=1 Tax=Mastomys coucha TaxID=35658 RepID=UPI0012628415|nr:PRAME family member 12-like [Mastomys coucha]XP_031196873.1 PRAME family member 12-like [Mastomys coucha]
MMSFKDIPTLQQLARRSLLKNEALTISGMQDLPIHLFPPLFKDAFTSKKTNILRQMVASWPFQCLPVGALMETPHLETLKAVLDGLDLLMALKDRPMRWKLQVVDLGDALHNFWNGQPGLQHVVWSPHDFGKNQPVENHPILGGKQTVTILMNLSLMSCRPSKYLKYFYRWAKQRKNTIQVICQKLEFRAIPAYDPLVVLKVFDPGSIQELEITTYWDIYTLALLAPGLGQMKNLQKLLFMEINIPLDRPRDREKEASCFREIFRQFSKLQKLQHLYLNNVYYLYEHLDQALRYLESPLETLAITHCMLSESDMKYLSQCPSIHQLKHLDLSGVTFIHLSEQFLGILLERLKATLQILKLKGYIFMDSKISTLLPALSQCSQLTEVNFVKNFFSMDSLKKLLQHTANLTQLTLEKYPAPDEVYDDLGDVIPDRFVQLCSELIDTLKGIRQPKQVYFVSKRCLHCQKFCIYSFVENI